MIERILHLSLGTHQTAQIRAIARLGHKSLCLDWKRIVEDELLEQILEFNPTVTFMQFQSAPVSENFVKLIPGLKFNWTGDIRLKIPHWYFTYADHVVTLFSNEQDVDTMRSMGHKADFLDIGYDPHIFTPHGVKTHSYDVVFFGNYYPEKFPLSDLRYTVVQKLIAKYKHRFGLFGKNWRNFFDFQVEDLNQQPDAEAAIYRSAKIAINLSHFKSRGYHSDRIYRITGSGCFCLSYNTGNFQRMFLPGKEVVTWDSVPELLDTIDYYLSDESKIQEIAKAGAERAFKNHTWLNRSEEFYHLIKKYGGK